MKFLGLGLYLIVTISILGCQDTSKAEMYDGNLEKIEADEIETPEYFMLRPEVKKAYGYSHAVKIGNAIKVSGAVSMDNEGNPTAIGDLAQQMKNCYADLDKILKHYDCTFDDVVVENVFTTDMPKFLKLQVIELKSIKSNFQQVLGLALRNWQYLNS